DRNVTGVQTCALPISPERVTTSTEARSGGEFEEHDVAGAGDQGLMFGYATNETEEYMPLPIAVAHRLSRRLTEVRKNDIVPHLRSEERRVGKECRTMR